MFNSITSLVISSLFLTACNNGANTEPTKKDNSVTAAKDTVPAIKPGDTDEHGCKTTTGEIWSIVRNSCILLADAGIKMNPQDPALDKTKLAWLVFSDDKIRVEIFLPTQTRPVIIRKNSGKLNPRDGHRVHLLYHL